jgi:hypothetical protein
MTLPNGLLLVANLQGSAVGCGALKLHIDTRIAEVKRMWVASDVRGLGLGRRLLERLAAEAASRGMVILSTGRFRSVSEVCLPNGGLRICVGWLTVHSRVGGSIAPLATIQISPSQNQGEISRKRGMNSTSRELALVSPCSQSDKSGRCLMQRPD